jgi:hypothetical protein
MTSRLSERKEPYRRPITSADALYARKKTAYSAMHATGGCQLLQLFDSHKLELPKFFWS